MHIRLNEMSDEFCMDIVYYNEALVNRDQLNEVAGTFSKIPLDIIS